MAKYNVFESVAMGTTHYSERIFDAIATTDIENGTFGYLNGLATNESVIYNFVPGTKSGEPVVVADNPAWTEDSSLKTNQRRDKYIIPAGTPFRVRVIKRGDEFATAIEGVTTASKTNMKVRAFVSIDATTGKLVAATTAAENAIMVGQVMRKRVSGATIATPTRTYGYSTELFEVKVTSLK